MCRDGPGSCRCSPVSPFDGATVGACVAVELAGLGGAQILRTIVFLNVGAVVFQFLVFFRTDVYALFVVASGCKNLWGTKGALARRTIGRATHEDQTLLETVGRREIFWAKIFLCLYVPGALWSAWYFVIYVVPALRRIIVMSRNAVAANGLLSLAGAAGAVAFVATLGSTAYILWGLIRTLARLSRRRAAIDRQSQA